MNVSKHADLRSQQRGISKEIIDVIITFGEKKRKPGNVWEFIVTKKKKQKMIKEIKHLLQLFDKSINKSVLVSDDDTIITTYIKN